jgi:hypothetical protein
MSGSAGARRLLVIAALVIEAAVAGAAEAPITLEEARAYMERDPEGAAADIVDLDAIEAAVPEVEMPGVVVTVTDRAAVVTYTGPMMVDVAGRLRYAITLPEARVEIPRSRPRWGVGVVVAVACAVVGFVGGMIAAR